MPEIRRYVAADGSCPFDERFDTLRDASAKVRILATIAKLEVGLKPDVKPVGEGVHEARIDHGPGYRIYFANDGTRLIILLMCGDKRTQPADIRASQGHWRHYKAAKDRSS